MKILQYVIVLFLLVCFVKKPYAQTQSGEATFDYTPIFYTSFDGSTDATIGDGNLSLYTAESYGTINEGTKGLNSKDISHVPGKGYIGDGLMFSKKSPNVIYYKAAQNTNFNTTSWSGTISFWLKLSPNEDLEPGYCDPFQLTDKAYNDAALWVDFTDKNPRIFRLGVFGDLEKWNPDGIEGDNPLFNNRLVPVEDPPFQSDTWTHVSIVFSELNTAKGTASLYLNGEKQGSSNIPESFSWDIDKAKIIIGVNYVGMFDELSIFDEQLNDLDIQKLYKVEQNFK